MLVHTWEKSDTGTKYTPAVYTLKLMITTISKSLMKAVYSFLKLSTYMYTYRVIYAPLTSSYNQQLRMVIIYSSTGTYFNSNAVP